MITYDEKEKSIIRIPSGYGNFTTVIETQPYYGGEGIDITDHIVSVTGVSKEQIVTGLGYVPFDEKKLPTKLSQFENDTDYATRSELPRKLSELINDAEYAHISDIPRNVSAYVNDANYATVGQLPTKVSELDNDLHYVRDYQLPTKVSDLINDAEYVTEEEASTAITESINNEKERAELAYMKKVDYVIDNAMSKTSTNPVANNVVTLYIDTMIDKINAVLEAL